MKSVSHGCSPLREILEYSQLRVSLLFSETLLGHCRPVRLPFFPVELRRSACQLPSTSTPSGKPTLPIKEQWKLCRRNSYGSTAQCLSMCFRSTRYLAKSLTRCKALVRRHLLISLCPPIRYSTCLLLSPGNPAILMANSSMRYRNVVIRVACIQSRNDKYSHVLTTFISLLRPPAPSSIFAVPTMTVIHQG